MPPEPITYQRAAAMRRALTPPEARLWVQLKGGRLAGLKFRRQHPVGPYILDFWCAAARVAIEIDGASHGVAGRPEHDVRRTEWLTTRRIEVLRFPATDVRDDLDGVLRIILHRCSGR